MTLHTLLYCAYLPSYYCWQNRVSNNTTFITCEYDSSKQHDKQAKLSSARALLTVASASRPAAFPVTRSSTKESPEPHFCLREPPCRPCNNVRAPTGRSSSQHSHSAVCTLLLDWTAWATATRNSSNPQHSHCHVRSKHQADSTPPVHLS